MQQSLKKLLFDYARWRLIRSLIENRLNNEKIFVSNEKQTSLSLSITHSFFPSHIHSLSGTHQSLSHTHTLSLSLSLSLALALYDTLTLFLSPTNLSTNNFKLKNFSGGWWLFSIMFLCLATVIATLSLSLSLSSLDLFLFCLSLSLNIFLFFSWGSEFNQNHSLLCVNQSDIFHDVTFDYGEKRQKMVEKRDRKMRLEKFRFSARWRHWTGNKISSYDEEPSLCLEMDGLEVYDEMCQGVYLF